MAWNTRLTYSPKLFCSVSSLMYSTRHLVPLRVRTIIVNTLEDGILTYRICVFAHCAKKWHVKINAILKRVLKSVAYNTPYLSSQEIFSALGLPTYFYFSFE